MNKTVARLLGEATNVAADAQVAPEAPMERPSDYSNPTVDQLMAVWQSGNHEAVALRVLDALDHYADFMALAFAIGQEGAMELGRIMDEMTAEEKSPHAHDTMPDEDIPARYGRKPMPAESDLISGSPE